jgi:hypothetical protein
MVPQTLKQALKTQQTLHHQQISRHLQTPQLQTTKH